MPISPERESRSSAASARLLLAAIAGRELPVVEGGTNDGVHFDGRSLVMPGGRDPDLFLAPMMVQAGLFAIGSFGRSALRRLSAKPDAARRYLVLESWRAAGELDRWWPRRLTERAELTPGGRPPANCGESLMRALGDEPLPEPAPLLGELRPLLVLRNADYADDDDALATPGDPADAPDVEAPVVEEEPAARRSPAPVDRSGGIISLLKVALGLHTKEAPGGGGDAIDSTAGLAMKRRRRAPLGLALPKIFLPAARQPGLDPVSGVHWHREWDAKQGGYRGRGAAIVETAPWRGHARLDAAHVLRQPSPTLRRALAGIGLGFEPRRHQPMGDDLVLDALVSLVVEARSGHAADERIYRRAMRTRRDLGVLILIDTSDSAGVNEGEQDVHEMQVSTGYQLADAFDRLGGRVAVAGFQSWGWRRTFFLYAKRFGQRLDAGVRERILDFDAMGFTRMGVAIRHAAHVLAEESGVPNPLLILVSDGAPYDRDGYEEAVADEDVRRAVAEARAAGCACLCICVGSTADGGRVEGIFGPERVLSIRRPADLDATIGRAVQGAIDADRVR